MAPNRSSLKLVQRRSPESEILDSVEESGADVHEQCAYAHGSCSAYDGSG